jgi:hypothetical protein
MFPASTPRPLQTFGGSRSGNAPRCMRHLHSAIADHLTPIISRGAATEAAFESDRIATFSLLP